MKGLSRRALREVDADEEGGLPAVLVDKREQDIKSLTMVDDDLVRTLTRVFEGTNLLGDQRKVKLLLKLRTDVTVAWGHTRDAFIEIGRALNDVDRELDADERDKLRAGFKELFPFSETVASQFRAIARAVDDGVLPKEVVPGSYGAAYQMALLTPGQREAARSAGLLTPRVSRDALLEFRRRNSALQPRGFDAGQIPAELAHLEREKRKMLTKLVELRRRIREIRAAVRMEA